MDAGAGGAAAVPRGAALAGAVARVLGGRLDGAAGAARGRGHSSAAAHPGGPGREERAVPPGQRAALAGAALRGRGDPAPAGGDPGGGAGRGDRCAAAALPLQRADEENAHAPRDGRHCASADGRGGALPHLQLRAAVQSAEPPRARRGPGGRRDGAVASVRLCAPPPYSYHPRSSRCLDTSGCAGTPATCCRKRRTRSL